MTSPEPRRRCRRLLLCATGAYQCVTLPAFILSLLRHVADDVEVVLSASAAKLVSPLAVAAASHHPVHVGTPGAEGEAEGPALELDSFDLVLVYPATANIVGKVANGLADDSVSAIVLATGAPVVFVPFANPAMWSHPPVPCNLARLSEMGYVVLPPQSGVEVSTREGLADHAAPFPLPTLLPRIAAALAAGSDVGRARRP